MHEPEVTNPEARAPYEQPELIDHGSMHDVTHGILGILPVGPFTQITIPPE